MLGWLATIRAGMTVAQWAAWWARFRQWQRDKKAERAAAKIAKLSVVLVALFLLTGATCVSNTVKDIDEYCRERPWECGGGPRPTPTPAPTAPTPPPGRVCGLNDCNCWHDPADGCDGCWLYIACAPA